MFVYSENREELTLKTKFQNVDFLDSLSTRTLHCLVLLCLVIFFSRKYFSIMNFLAESLTILRHITHYCLMLSLVLTYYRLESVQNINSLPTLLAKLINKNQINDTQFCISNKSGQQYQLNILCIEKIAKGLLHKNMSETLFLLRWFHIIKFYPSVTGAPTTKKKQDIQITHHFC